MSGEPEPVTDLLPDATRAFDDMCAEVYRQDSFHAGYTANRDSLRLALATVEDEVREALDGWREDRCKCGVPQCSCSTWPHLREEALQAAAIILRMVRAIDQGTAALYGVTPAVNGGSAPLADRQPEVSAPAVADDAGRAAATKGGLSAVAADETNRPDLVTHPEETT